ncbi:MAG TPA: S41 family peptidase [Pirellulaceae bacterium]
MPPRNFWTILLAGMISLACHLRAAHNRYAATLADAMEEVRSSYVEPVDQRRLFENAMEGMIGKLDPYSSFIPPEDYERWKEELDQEFGGIGVVVKLDPDSRRPMVMSPIPDSPAYRAGIRAGDLLLSVDGVETSADAMEDILHRVKGAPKTIVRLRILPYGKKDPVDLTVARALIPIESVMGDSRRSDGGWVYRLEEHPEIGYVRVGLFGEHTSTELREVLTELTPRIQSLILDLRGNQGGLLDAAVETCDLFLARGEIVRELGRDRRLRERFIASPGNDVVPAEMPMVALVDMFSASASEIVAACLQDHKRATIIGQRTWGKGTVQRLFEMEGGRSALRLTTATYWRPSGKNIHREADDPPEATWGVSPDQGFDVRLDKDAYVQMLEARGERDAVRLSSPTEANESPHPPAPTRDAQLTKAIEHLLHDTSPST